MEWKCLEDDWPKLYLSQSPVCEQSRILGNEHNRLDREAEECNCSKQRWDVSSDRGVSGVTIIATNCR